MADDATPRLTLPLLFAGQALKETFHNQALARLDALVQPVVLSANISTPPELPTAGAAWIVGEDPNGAWSLHAGEIACWSNGWLFIAPDVGWRCYVRDRGHALTYDGTAWVDDAARENGFYVDGLRVIGTQQAAIGDVTGGATVDAESRAAIASILGALRSHGLVAES